MAIALLQGKTGHTVSYDLESLSTSYWPYLSFSGHSVTLTRIMDWFITRKAASLRGFTFDQFGLLGF